mgnify:FL=1
MNSVNEENAIVRERARIRAEVVSLANVELKGDGKKLVALSDVLAIVRNSNHGDINT